MDYNNQNVTKVLTNLIKFNENLEMGMELFKMIAKVQAMTNPKDAEVAEKIVALFVNQKVAVDEMIRLLNEV